MNNLLYREYFGLGLMIGIAFCLVLMVIVLKTFPSLTAGELVAGVGLPVWFASAIWSFRYQYKRRKKEDVNGRL